MDWRLKLHKNQQIILLLLGLIPGALAVTKVLTPGQATIGLIVLFFFSRRHANALQRQYEADEAQRVQEVERQAALVKRKGKGKGKGDWIFGSVNSLPRHCLQRRPVRPRVIEDMEFFSSRSWTSVVRVLNWYVRQTWWILLVQLNLHISSRSYFTRANKLLNAVARIICPEIHSKFSIQEDFSSVSCVYCIPRLCRRKKIWYRLNFMVHPFKVWWSFVDVSNVLVRPLLLLPA